MTVEKFYNDNYEDDPNHFYTQVRGVAVISPRKVQGAMEQYADEKVKDVVCANCSMSTDDFKTVAELTK